MAEKIGSVMVVGGGVGGIQASLDLAEMGFKVYLVEEKPAIGGVMAQLDKTFPTNDCSMCLLSPKLVDIGRHPNIRLITYSELEKIRGEPGNFMVTLKKKPRFVNEEKCTGCGGCWNNCPVKNIAYFERERSEVELKNKEEVERIISAHQGEHGILMPVLHDINVKYNHLPKDVLKYVSKELDIPLSQIYSLATFYNIFSLTPRGRHVIQVCSGTACHVRGGERILERLERDLKIASGKTTSDQKFTLEQVRCVGCCSLAPVVRIDKDTYGRVKQQRIPKILKKYE